MVQAFKVRRGLYELRGVTHTKPRYRGAPPCGGQVFAQFCPEEMDKDEVLPASWECFCEKCQDCDPDGWNTLKECLVEAPKSWCAAVAAGART